MFAVNVVRMLRQRELIRRLTYAPSKRWVYAKETSRTIECVTSNPILADDATG
jgi:hypothetical protein